MSDGTVCSCERVRYAVAPDFCFILVGGYGKRGHQRTAPNNRKTGVLVSRYGIRSQLRRGVLRLFGGSAFWSSPLALAGFFQQLDISHGSPRDERSPCVFFFGVFFDGFYGDSTGIVADQSSVEAAPSREPHGYSLSVPLLRQVPGQRASPVRLLSPGILPLPVSFALVRRQPRGCVWRACVVRPS